ncbi:MAG: hypothetical protein WCP53_01490 [Verrucomicrobiota bacterium]
MNGVVSQSVHSGGPNQAALRRHLGVWSTKGSSGAKTVVSPAWLLTFRWSSSLCDSSRP